MNHDARNWARDLDLNGPRGKRAVLVSLGDHANEHWASWPSRKLIAKETDFTPRTVSNYLRDLVHDGLIVPVPWRNEEGGDAGSGYFLTGMPGAPNFAPISVAFKDRRYGFPRGHMPAWWSGEKRGDQTPVQDPLWGEGPTGRTPGSHPWEGEGPTGRTPLEPSEEPSIKNSATAAPASAYAEAGTSRSDVWADADSADRATADAAPAAGVASVIQISTQRQNRAAGAAAKTRNPNASERRDADRHARIEAMPDDRVEAVLNKYARSHPKGYEWASRMACGELPSGLKPEYGGDGYDRFLRRVYWWALKFHNKHQNWPQALLWALDDNEVEAAEAVAARRKERVTWLSCKAGAEDDVLKGMYKAVNAMDPAARTEMADDIRTRKPRIWAKAYAGAVGQLAEDGHAEDAVNVTRLAMQYVVKHYRDSDSEKKRWPSFVVPPSLRPTAETKAA